MKVFIETYGCTLNQADSEIMKGVLSKEGAEIGGSADEADVVILNTCFVKTPTQQCIIDRLRKLAGKRVVVAGCMPSANRRMVEKISPLAPMVGPCSLSRIHEAVLAAYEGRKEVFLEKKPEDKYLLPRSREGVIARIPVSEGCSSLCSFCVTKLARPVLHSYAERSILNEIERCVGAGFREIQLTSMDAGAYGLDSETNLASLMGKIDGIKGKFLVRVGMINPEHALRMLPELMDAFKSKKVYRFLHIPLQSGDDGVLEDMGRRYSVDGFRKVVEEFRREFPELTLATDIIVGFPTESENAFEKTIGVIKEIEPDVVNNSKFSPRPGTKAASMKRLPNDVVARRSRLMSALCREISLKNNRESIGSRFEVLLTEIRGSNMAGRTHTYKQVIVKGGELGEFVNVRICDAATCHLKGII